MMKVFDKAHSVQDCKDKRNRLNTREMEKGDILHSVVQYYKIVMVTIIISYQSNRLVKGPQCFDWQSIQLYTLCTSHSKYPLQTR